MALPPPLPAGAAQNGRRRPEDLPVVRERIAMLRDLHEVGLLGLYCTLRLQEFMAASRARSAPSVRAARLVERMRALDRERLLAA